MVKLKTLAIIFILFVIAILLLVSAEKQKFFVEKLDDKGLAQMECLNETMKLKEKGWKCVQDCEFIDTGVLFSTGYHFTCQKFSILGRAVRGG